MDPMARKELDRFAALAADIGSPRVVPAIDRALVENQRERTELLKLREMAVERHGELGGVGASNRKLESTLTVGALLNRYRADEGGSYLKLPFKSRKHYDSFHNRIEEKCGELKIAELQEQKIQHLHEQWVNEVVANGKGGDGTAMARGLVTHLRLLINYGAVVLGDGECARVSVLLRTMRFSAVKSRNSKGLVAEQVVAIRAKAHEMGMHSIALAQALQFDCGLLQRDVIGEWVPVDEPGDSDVVHEDQKWLRGFRWEEIGSNLIMRNGINLRNAPMVIEEFDCIGILPTAGPMIVCEKTHRPWSPETFRQKWREIANEAGIPKNVYNMDSRKKTASAPPQNGHTETRWTNHWDIPVGAKAQ